jgi:ATP-dependent Clp protease ATP-binding subunit ClpA
MGVGPFEQLVAQVDQIATSGDPLDRVDAAVIVATTLNGHADTLVDHAVSQARAAGRSWTEIGARLGVSKQAARKRFVDPVASWPTPVLPPQVSLRPRLQNCLARADELAQQAGAAQVGGEHLLAGLLTEGVGASIMNKLGVTADAIAASTARLFGPAGPPSSTVPPLSADAVCAIETAAHCAQTCAEHPNHVTVGTEHLLAALAFDHSCRAHRILVDLGVDIAAVKKRYLPLKPPRSRRPRRVRRSRRTTPAPACSFCGASDRPLAQGPGVTICTVCAQRATQSLAMRAGS